MPFVPVPLAAEVSLDYLYNDQQMKTVLHFIQAGESEWDGTSLTALANDVLIAWPTTIGTVMNELVALVSVSARALYSDTAPGVVVSPETPLFGDLDADGGVWTDSTAFVLKKGTGFTGRSFRGRIYHFGGTLGSLADAGHVNYADAITIRDAYEAFRVAMALESTLPLMVVVSKYSGMANVIVDGRYKRVPIPRDEGIATEVNQIVFSDTALDSQRRRLPGRGT